MYNADKGICEVDYETDIDNLPTLGDLASKDKVDWDTDIDDIPQTFPPSDHNHDGRYYTVSEMNTALASKANSADVYSKTEADELLNEKFDKDPDSTLTGSILSFEAAVENAIKDLTVEINPVQDLHGLSNPYPAGGGKNLANMIDDNTVPSVNNGALVPYNGSRSDYIKVNPNTTYTASFEYSQFNAVVEYDTNKGFVK